MTRIFSGLTAIAVSASVAGCVMPPGSSPNMQRIYDLTLAACLFAPTAETIIAIWDQEGRSQRAVETARVICSAFIANPQAPVAGAVEVEGAAVMPGA